MNSVKNRIMEMLDHFEIKPAAFEKKAGISNGYINNLKGSVGSDIIGRICAAFPDIEPLWLLIGEGEMLKNPVINQKIGRVDSIKAGTVAGPSRGDVNFGASDRQKELEAENARLKEDNKALRENNQKLLDQVFKLTDRLLDK